ncbi:Hypothetical predicted protein [Pelobates cultripes]|uniref:Uncharacterized protein n=1 Tax=Pelobates cultripes TaxID=61616 RepID=A0AAD1TFF5_PELCU|nr:Hypothetical predicted protein [Pelobates cultripes]
MRFVTNSLLHQKQVWGQNPLPSRPPQGDTRRWNPARLQEHTSKQQNYQGSTPPHLPRRRRPPRLRSWRQQAIPSFTAARVSTPKPAAAENRTPPTAAEIHFHTLSTAAAGKHKAPVDTRNPDSQCKLSSS